MRQLFGWFSVVVFTSGCSANSLPFSPTTPSMMSSGSRLSFNPSVVTDGNWSPWFWGGWQPGIGEPLVPGAAINAVVEVDDLCAPNLRRVWDFRASCRRFLVSVPSHGWLDASLRWDDSAPGFDLSLAGEVVLVAPDGRFTASGWQHAEEDIFALVQPGNYGVLVMSYVPASLPFQISTAFRPD